MRLRDGIPPKLDTFVAYVTLFLLLVKLPGLSLLPIMALPAIAFSIAGLFIPTCMRYWGMRSLVWSCLGAMIVGLLLRFLASGEAIPSSSFGFTTTIVWLLAFPALALAALWAFERVDLRRGIIALMSGAMASALATSPALEWKGDIGVSATFLLLAVVAGKRMIWTQIVLASALVMNAIDDSRFMATLSCIILICTMLRPRQIDWIRRHLKKSLFFALSGFAIMVFLIIQAMLGGLLGKEIQERTLRQTTGGHNLITSGRAEWAATLELFSQRPWGFGVGMTPSPELQSAALNAIKAAGGDYTATAYWTELVFAERTDLHSTVANLWLHFGIGGILLAVIMAYILLAGYPRAIGWLGDLGAVPLFAVLTASWDLLFSPMANSDRIVLGLVMSMVLIALQRPSKHLSASQLTNAPSHSTVMNSRQNFLTQQALS